MYSSQVLTSVQKLEGLQHEKLIFNFMNDIHICCRFYITVLQNMYAGISGPML